MTASTPVQIPPCMRAFSFQISDEQRFFLEQYRRAQGFTSAGQAARHLLEIAREATGAD